MILVINEWNKEKNHMLVSKTVISPKIPKLWKRITKSCVSWFYTTKKSGKTECSSENVTWHIYVFLLEGLIGFIICWSLFSEHWETLNEYPKDKLALTPWIRVPGLPYSVYEYMIFWVEKCMLCGSSSKWSTLRQYNSDVVWA